MASLPEIFRWCWAIVHTPSSGGSRITSVSSYPSHTPRQHWAQRSRFRPSMEKRYLTISPGTQSGDVLRMRKMGFCSVHSSRKGDQLVEATIEVPLELGPEERQLLERLAEIEEKEVGTRRRGSLSASRNTSGRKRSHGE